jgi:ankyrin repeat protein
LLHLVTCLHTQRADEDGSLLDIRRRLHTVVHKVDPRTTAGDSLLHLSVMKNNTIKSQNLFDDSKFAFFPSIEVTKLLVECGAKINAMNSTGNTPLHTVSYLANYRQEVCVLNVAHIINLYLFR